MAVKTLTQWGLTAKVEAARNTFNQPATATDGVLAITRPDVEIDYAHDGARNGTGGNQLGLRPVGLSGRYGKTNIEHEFVGAGVAHDATHVPSPTTLLRGAGWDVAYNLGVATFTPSPADTDVSVSIESYYRGLKAQLAGAIGQVKIDGDAGAIPKAVFDYQGIMTALPVNAAVPGIVYAGAQANDPQKLNAGQFTIAGFVAARLKSFSFADNRNIAARNLDNATGDHGGWLAGAERVITLDVVIEADDLANLNPYTVREAANAQALALNIGAAAFYRWQIAAPKGVLLTVPEQDENNAAMWNLQFRLFPSALGLSDAASLIFPVT